MKTSEQRYKNNRSLWVLPKTFTDKGWLFEQLRRDGLLAIYRKKKENWKDCWCYEVVKIQECPTYSIAGVTIEAHEAMPSAESFGVKGFAVNSYEEAIKKLEWMKNQEKEIENPPVLDIVVEKRKRGRPKKKK